MRCVAATLSEPGAPRPAPPLPHTSTHSAADEARSGAGFWIAPLLVACVALALRLFHLHELADTPLLDSPEPLADSTYYHDRALEIARGDFVGSRPSYLSPLYCAVLGGVYALFGPSLAAAKIFQALLGAASCVLLWDVTRRLFSRAAALVAALLLATWDLHIYYTGLLIPTVLVLFLNLAVLASICAWQQQITLARCLAVGALVGLATLAKANALLLIPLVAYSAWRCAPVARRTVLSVAVVASSLLCIAPTSLIESQRLGRPILVTNTGAVNLYKGNGPSATGTHVFLSRAERQAMRDARNGRGPGLNELTWQHVRSSPGTAAGLLLRKARLMVNAAELVIRDQVHFAREELPLSLLRAPLPGFGAIAPIALCGAVLAWPTRRRSYPLYGILAAQLCSFVLVFVLARYRLVFAACLLPFAGWQLVQWSGWLRERSGRPLLGSVLLVVAFGLLVHWPTELDQPHRGYADQYALLARSALRHGELDEAARLFGRALETQWTVGTAQRDALAIAEVHLGLARIALRRRNPNAAEASLASAKALLKALELPEDRDTRELRQLRKRVKRLTKRLARQRS